MITNTASRRTRESRVLLLAPAAILLFFYAAVFAMPRQQELSALHAQADAVRQSAVSQDDADLSRQQLEKTQSAVQQLTLQIEEDRYLIRSLAESMRAPEARVETAQLVTEILQQFNLSINNQKFASAPELSEYLADLASKIDEHCPESPLEYWEIEVAGQYHDVLRFLREVRTSGMRTFPLTLRMTSSPRDGVHTWTIVFVI